MTDILFTLLRTTLFLTICGGLCFLALRKVEHRLPHLSRLLWVAVLLTGWCWVQVAIEIPVEGGKDHPAATRHPSTGGELFPQEGNYFALQNTHNPPPVNENYFAQQNAHNSPPVNENYFAQQNAHNSPPVEGWHFAQQNDGVVSPIPTPLFSLWLVGMLFTILLSAGGYLRILCRLRYTVPAEDGDVREPGTASPFALRCIFLPPIL